MDKRYTTIRILDYIAAALVMAVMLAMIILAKVGVKSLFHRCPEPTTETVIERQPLTGWGMFTLAIAKTESEYDSTATNGDAWGILQIRPIYVEDCNRILGIDRYCHDDAFSIRKSLEMFSVIQEHYNPEHDVRRALELQNPAAGPCYESAVLRNLREIARENEIINQL